MYSTLPHFVLGFHGCDKSVADRIIPTNKLHLQKSENDYDWLGHGIYFWENDPVRALEYARFLRDHPERNKSNVVISKPTVIGAILDLGYCLNLLEAKSIDAVKQAYKSLVELHMASGIDLPQNKKIKGTGELLLRNLDCAVVEAVHFFNGQSREKQYDTVRGMFIEGQPLYANAGFHDKNHIQICVRNVNCIKGYFHPRTAEEAVPIP
jgi:hypothetical protein